MYEGFVDKEHRVPRRPAPPNLVPSAPEDGLYELSGHGDIASAPTSLQGLSRAKRAKQVAIVDHKSELSIQRASPKYPKLPP